MLARREPDGQRSRERQRSRNVLVIAQVAMALVLLVSAVLMIRTFAALRNVEPRLLPIPHIADHAHLRFPTR